MGPLDFLNHLANFLLPALGVGVWTATGAKLLWRADLRRVAWWRLCVWSVGLGVLASVGSVVLTGQDGRVLGYVALVLASALGVWLKGWIRR